MARSAPGPETPPPQRRENHLARKLALFVPLSESDRRLLDRLTATEELFRTDTDIVAEGMMPRSVFLLQDGMAVRYRNLPDGRRQIMTFLLPGDLCDPHIFLLRAMDHSIGTLTPVRVSPISRQGLMKTFATRPRISAALWWASLQEEAMLRERIVSLGRRDARGRIAYLVCELLWRHAAIGQAEGEAFRLPLTQTELGDALGLTPVHVNRVLREFREQRLIAMEGRLLRVLDVARLQDIAAFDDAYLHFGGASPEVVRYFDQLDARQRRNDDEAPAPPPNPAASPPRPASRRAPPCSLTPRRYTCRTATTPGRRLMHMDWMLGTLGTVPGDIFALLRLALALCATAHVLLTKRNTRSSIAWIGFAWISPLFGTALYFGFGINRVSRRARKLRRRLHNPADQVPDTDGRDDHLGPLEAAARTITKRPALAGNRVERFENGDEAYPRMLAAIDGAKASVGLASYIFFDDAGGRPFIDALTRAHQRGVQVRVLVDGVGSGYFRCKAASALHAAGVPVDRFLHSVLPWRMPFINLRNHKKVLVVDGTLGFTGGMNISAANLVATQPPDPVRDTHFLFEGPVVGQLTEAFAADWTFATEEELDGPAWYPDTLEDGPATARVITAGPDQDIEKIELVILQAIASAERCVRLMTPYFLPDERLMTALSLAAMRGVEVDIVVPEKSDHRAVDWAARNNFGPLNDAGCRIWLNPPPFDHSKIMIVDRTWALIGSTNWDTRSFRLNFELNLEVYHSDLAEDLDRLVESKQGRRVRNKELRARSVPVRLRDGLMRLTQPYL